MTKEIVSMKELLEAGVYFGHKVSNWNPKMKNYIFIKRRGVHIINLQKTLLLFEQAYNFVKNITANGGKILFVGTKKQAQKSIEEHASRCHQYYINHHWVGGLLTNFSVVKQSVDKIDKLRAIIADEEAKKRYLKRDLLKMEKSLKKLEESFLGIKDMKKLPDLLFIVDSHMEDSAVNEGNTMGIPICAMVDTNSSPDRIDIVIPSNDDAVRSIDIFVSRIADAALEGKNLLDVTRTETLVAKDDELPHDETLPDELVPEREQAATKHVTPSKFSKSPSDSSSAPPHLRVKPSSKPTHPSSKDRFAQNQAAKPKSTHSQFKSSQEQPSKVNATSKKPASAQNSATKPRSTTQSTHSQSKSPQEQSSKINASPKTSASAQNSATKPPISSSSAPKDTAKDKASTSTSENKADSAPHATKTSKKPNQTSTSSTTTAKPKSPPPQSATPEKPKPTKPKPEQLGKNTPVSAQAVKELRDLTQAGMMECKTALTEANGNKAEAMRLLKERGMLLAEKKNVSRDAHEGVIFIEQSATHTNALQCLCETDFVAKNDDFKAFVTATGKAFLKKGDAFLKSPEAETMLSEIVTKLREKIVIGETVTIEHQKNTLTGFYLHTNQKAAALVTATLPEKDLPTLNKAALHAVLKDVCMQITAMNPIALSVADIDAETKDQERQIFLKQMENEDKKPDIKAKIIEGKLKKYFAERCLLEMNFVKDSKLSVKKYLESQAQSCGLSAITLQSMKRLQIGKS